MNDLTNLLPKPRKVRALKEFLQEALTHQGIGAKTAIGYGRMQKKQ